MRGAMSKRDWKRIDEVLVRRRELLLDLDFKKGWEGELDAMNRGREGARFRYPDSSILIFMHVYLHLLYQQLEGFTRILSSHAKRLKPLDHSSIQWRTEEMSLKLDGVVVESGGDVVIAVGATGIKVANWGDWIRHRWKVRRG